MRTFNPLAVKITPVALLVCLVLLAGTCKKSPDKTTMDFTQTIVGKTWLHSHEDDRGDTINYRPNSYDFPPSRGRTGFLIEANGTIRQYDIAPTDGLEEHLGKWNMRNEKTMEITFPDKKATDYEVEILSAEPSLLKVKRKYKII